LQWLGQVNDPNLHLVPVAYDKSLRDDYLPSQLTAVDYPNLISSNAPVDTISAEAVLASYNWQPGSDRFRRLSLLVEQLFGKMSQLQRPPYHPKWQELAPMAPVAGWTRFRTAQEWLDRNTPMASANVPAPAQASGPAARDDTALYREFLEWRANRQHQPVPR
jgi:branched-chain amino acid transport system substrate-binding protein